MAQEDHWLPGFNFNVEEWDARGQTYETLAICRTLALATAAFAAAIALRPLHDPQPEAGGAAVPEGRLVKGAATKAKALTVPHPDRAPLATVKADASHVASCQ